MPFFVGLLNQRFKDLGGIWSKFFKTTKICQVIGIWIRLPECRMGGINAFDKINLFSGGGIRWW
ncbi:hypothetical protein Hanom_Chr11g00996691 [Helianthus anomalus]